MQAAAVELQEMEAMEEQQAAVVVEVAVLVRNGLQPQAVVALLTAVEVEAAVRVMQAQEALAAVV
jgi:hypothetical protein